MRRQELTVARNTPVRFKAPDVEAIREWKGRPRKASVAQSGRRYRRARRFGSLSAAGLLVNRSFRPTIEQSQPLCHYPFSAVRLARNIPNCTYILQASVLCMVFSGHEMRPPCSNCRFRTHLAGLERVIDRVSRRPTVLRRA